ncbi:MAG TPA: sulfatase-like hydrolase/transferase [Terriglobia bacterium]|nr:sulfatase-like hydrolase/transferase [Terriglobia bacterium]
MNRREFMGTTVAAGLVLQQARVLPTRPNVIFILADDMGYGDLSCYGRPDYKTPVLDGLASEGVRFTDAYAAAAVCTPTRVGFHTGRYPQRLPIGLQEPLSDANATLGIPVEHPTISSLLKANDYESILIGKYHLGNDPKFNPLKHGFSEFFGIVGAGETYFTHRNTQGVMDLFDGERAVEMDGYLTDLFTDRAVQFIRRNRTRPFYMSLHYNAPHWPWEGPGDRATGMSNQRAGVAGGSQEIYGEMVKSMDSGIGKVLQALRDRGLERNTLIVFTSDNGGERYSNIWPFSFQKTFLWEGGIRVPAIVRWPGVIPDHRTTNQAAITMDWTATFLAVTGAKASPEYPLDGTNLMGVFTGEQAPFERTLFWRNNAYDAARMGNWKYLIENNTEHLFDLSTDPGEKFDLKDKETAVFSKIQSAYRGWNQSVLARPTAGARGQAPGGARGQAPGARGGQRGQQ